MKHLIIFLMLVICSSCAYSQSSFGDSEPYGIEIIYAAKLTQSGSSAPTLSDQYNPYAVSVSTVRDSAGCARVLLTYPVGFAVSAGLHPFLTSNTNLKTAKVYAVESGGVVTVRTFIKQSENYSDNYTATLILYYVK